MNFVFISPHFPPSFYHFCVELKNAGANVLAIGDAPGTEFRPELLGCITEYCQLDMHDYEIVYRTIAYFANKYGRIDRIDSHNEYWLALEAQIRQDFNIYGQKPEDLLLNQSKTGMKKVFKQFGIPAAEALLIEHPDELHDFVSRYGFPFIVKPDRGVGASYTYKVKNEQQLNDLLRDLPHGFIIEPFVDGTTVTFDGLVDKDGKIMYYSSFELSDNVLDILNEKRDMFYYYKRDIDPNLEAAGRAMVKGFNVRERFFHCEFFKRPDGSYWAIEINVRVPGGFSIDMLNYVSDVNLFKIWAELVVQNRNFLSYSRKYNVSNVSRRDQNTYKHTHKDIMSQFGDMVVQYTRIPEAFAAAMGNDTYIIRHPDKDTLLKACQYINEKV
ncbi:MAG TPA: carboxylate--amine ligase [Lentisphaeria bacterium]|nr:MAG: hypothetical protein A2X47_13715 [Lentisphaerae bacterium GWF2_38_69]HBM17398.1 carboxylate--amine ligase [Lentisphaeria bacterium]